MVDSFYFIVLFLSLGTAIWSLVRWLVAVVRDTWSLRRDTPWTERISQSVKFFEKHASKFLLSVVLFTITGCLTITFFQLNQTFLIELRIGLSEWLAANSEVVGSENFINAINFIAPVIGLLISFSVFLFQNFSLKESLDDQLGQLEEISRSLAVGSEPMKPNEVFDMVKRGFEEKLIEHFVFFSGKSTLPFFWLNQEQAEATVEFLSGIEHNEIPKYFVGPTDRDFADLCKVLANDIVKTPLNSLSPRFLGWVSTALQKAGVENITTIKKAKKGDREVLIEGFQNAFSDTVFEEYRDMMNFLQEPKLRNNFVRHRNNMTSRNGNFVLIKYYKPVLGHRNELIVFADPSIFNNVETSPDHGYLASLLQEPVIYKTRNPIVSAPIFDDVQSLINS